MQLHAAARQVPFDKGLDPLSLGRLRFAARQRVQHVADQLDDRRLPGATSADEAIQAVSKVENGTVEKAAGDRDGADAMRRL